MPDTQIHPQGVEAAPADYKIADAAELLLKMAFATFDGTGAAGSFKPCLRIISDAGTVAGEAVADDVVAAGASADVTWFPRVAAAGGGASTTNAEWFIARRTSNLTMLAATTETIVWSDLHSSDSSLFSLSNVDRPNDSVAVAREGVVLFNAWALAGALEPNFVMGLVLNSSNGVSMNTNTPQNQYNTKGATPPTLFGPAQTAIVIPDAVPYQVYAEYDNLDAVNHVLATSQMWGLWWPTGALSPF